MVIATLKWSFAAVVLAVSPGPEQATSSSNVAPDISVRIADCESGARQRDGSALPYSYRLDAQNPVSSASGKYQFINSTWEWVTGLPAPAKAYDEATQDAAFWKLWDEGRGAYHWNPSRNCWSR